MDHRPRFSSSGIGAALADPRPGVGRTAGVHRGRDLGDGRRGPWTVHGTVPWTAHAASGAFDSHGSPVVAPPASWRLDCNGGHRPVRHALLGREPRCRGCSAHASKHSRRFTSREGTNMKLAGTLVAATLGKIG